MRTKNLETVQRIFEAFQRGDIPAVLDRFDANAEWIFPGDPEIPFAGSGRGHEIVSRHFKQVYSTIRPLAFEVTRLIADDEAVTALVHIRAQVHSTGKDYANDGAMVFIFANDVVRRFEIFYDSRRVASAFQQ